MQYYRHTQIGYTILASLGGTGIFLAIATNFSQDNIRALKSVPAILIICALLFGSLTIEIENGILKVKFGPGLIRKSYRITDIKTCEMVHNPWYYGWGIHLTPHGWLFNVSGTAAIEIAMKNGRKFRLGTDEPELLCRAILAAKERSIA